MKTAKRCIAFVVTLALMLSMATVVSAAETKICSASGADLFSVTNVLKSYVETYEDMGEVFHDEIMECAAPVTVTVLKSDIQMIEFMDHTYEIQTGDTHETGFIMPDNCPDEKAYWETDTYRDRLAIGTTYTLTEPGTYGINLHFDDGTSYYANIIIDGERTKDAANFTKAYYQQRQENAVTGANQQIANGLNSTLLSVTNVMNHDGFVKMENQNTGEIGELPVYSCLAPATATALVDLTGFELWELVEKDGICRPWTPYMANDEDIEAFNTRNENGTPAGTEFTVTRGDALFYLYASDGNETVHAVLRIDGAAPININNGTTSETIQFWSEIPNGSATINGLYDITYDEDGEPIYVIDKNSTITYNSYLSDYINIYAENAVDGTPLLESAICTPIVYNTVSYLDNLMWYDEESEMKNTIQVTPGMTVQFNTVGHHWIQVTPGYASREERLAIQFNENTNYGWQWSPPICVWVIDPAPFASYTASKVIVNGVETEFEAYNINGNNYFKLRDVAMAINGTNKQFGVYWDGEKNAISLLSFAPYTPVGGELAKGDGTSKSSIMMTSIVYKDQKPVNLSAYNINGNNYFKLRDLGETFDFDVTWDSANNCIMIDTANSYTAD